MRVARGLILLSSSLAACSPLRMTAPETGAGGQAGSTTGAAGSGGLVGTGGTGGIGTAGTTGTGGGGMGGTGGGGTGGTSGGGPAGGGGQAGSTTGAAGSGGLVGTGGTSGVGTAGTTGTGGGGKGGTGGGGPGGTGGGGPAGAGGSAEPAGLIAHWLFNEGRERSVADSSGNGQPMTLSATGGNWTPSGHEGSAITLDGVSGFAEMLPTAGQALYDYPIIKLTFSAWVKPNATAASRAFAAAVARAHEDYAFQDFWIGLVNGKPGCIIHSSDWLGAVSSAVAPAGAWTNIACTYALDGQVILYVNGASVASASSDQTIGPIPPRILVGADEVDPGSGITLQHFFPGAIDDVRIYNETLTPSEVAFIAR